MGRVLLKESEPRLRAIERLSQTVEADAAEKQIAEVMTDRLASWAHGQQPKSAMVLDLVRARSNAEKAAHKRNADYTAGNGGDEEDTSHPAAAAPPPPPPPKKKQKAKAVAALTRQPPEAVKEGVRGRRSIHTHLYVLDAHLKTCIALLDYLQDCGLSCP